MRELTLFILCWSMLLIAAVTLVYPWRFRTRISRILVHLPLSLVLLWLIYEALMPVEMNIRVDLDILQPAFLIAGICYVTKLVLLFKHPRVA